jgi:hypothetical protein
MKLAANRAAMPIGKIAGKRRLAVRTSDGDSEIRRIAVAFLTQIERYD